jgi:pyruvate dehydrogenase complex dihydrolipoamide acetyltransferase long form
MATEFKVPDLGENIESGDIVSVLVNAGDVIKANQNVFEIETGKAVVELPCPHAGKIAKVHVQKGAKVKVGDPLLTLDANGATSPVAPAPTKTPAATTTPAAPVVPSTPAAAPALKPSPLPAAPAPRAIEPASLPNPAKVPPAGPATRRLARELGVDLGLVEGSGPGGRITEDDVKSAVRQTGGPSRPTTAQVPILKGAPLPEGTDGRDDHGPIRAQRMTSIRKTIALHMLHSTTTIPHVTNFDDADITELERIRKGGMADYVGSSVKLTLLPFVMKAVAQSLRLHPLLNCSVDMENEQVIFKDYVNIGVAVDTERGLVVPVVRNVDRLSIPRIAQETTSLIEKARNSQLTLADFKGSTFTISNLGAVGGTYSTPVINSPDVAILLLGRSRRLAIVGEGDKVEVRLMMPLSLSYDHRVVDGAAAARFLNEIINYLKVPGRLLLAP